MFEFLKKWFKKDDKKAEVHKSNKSDGIRKYVKGKFIIPARGKQEKRVTFTAHDIAKGMDLEGRYPMICSAIDSKKFLEFARVVLIRREGPGQGAAAKWTFKVK